MIVRIDKFLVAGAIDIDSADVMSAGRLFQMRGPATGKARVPIVDIFKWWHHQAVSASIAKRLSTRQIGDTNNRSEILWCDPMHNPER